mgnify:CR=1 FL=1
MLYPQELHEDYLDIPDREQKERERRHRRPCHRRSCRSARPRLTSSLAGWWSARGAAQRPTSLVSALAHLRLPAPSRRRKIDPYAHSPDIGWNPNWKMKDQQTENRARFTNYPGSVYSGRVKSTKTFQSEFSLQ